MNPSILSLFPNASKTFLALNADPGARVPGPEPQPPPQAPLVGRAPGEAARRPRVALGYRASVVRPLDLDNLAGATKHVTDALVRCGLLHGDSPEQVEISWSQERVAHFDEEKLTITITEGGRQKKCRR